MGMANNPDATRFQVNTPLTRELLDLIDQARLPLRLSRAEFARRAFAAYCEQTSWEAA